MTAMQPSGLQACEQVSPANRYDTVKPTQCCNELARSIHAIGRPSQLSVPSSTSGLLVLTCQGSRLSQRAKAAAAMGCSILPGRLIKRAPVVVHMLATLPGQVSLRVDWLSVIQDLSGSQPSRTSVPPVVVGFTTQSRFSATGRRWFFMLRP